MTQLMKKTELRSIPLSKIQENPHRDLKRYPWNEEKIEALMASINSTGFWPNLTARPVRGKRGSVEIAYGHHRVEALRRLYPETDESINITVSRFDETEMLKMMAAENHANWSNAAQTDIETVRAVMKAAADGLIPFPDANGKGQGVGQKKRKARTSRISFSSQTIADFLEWTDSRGRADHKARAAFIATQLIDEGYLEESSLHELSSNQLEQVVATASRAKKKAETDAKAHEATAARAKEQGLKKEEKESKVQASKTRKTAAETSKSGAGALAAGLKEGQVSSADAQSKGDALVKAEKEKRGVESPRSKAKKPSISKTVSTAASYLAKLHKAAPMQKIRTIVDNVEDVDRVYYIELVSMHEQLDNCIDFLTELKTDLVAKFTGPEPEAVIVTVDETDNNGQSQLTA